VPSSVSKMSVHEIQGVVHTSDSSAAWTASSDMSASACLSATNWMVAPMLFAATRPPAKAVRGHPALWSKCPRNDLASATSLADPARPGMRAATHPYIARRVALKGELTRLASDIFAIDRVMKMNDLDGFHKFT